MPEIHATYVLYSEKADKLYIGYSSSSLDRFHWHNTKAKKGFTIRYRPWKMIHVEFFETKRAAMAREKTLKEGKGREWIRQEILSALIHTGFISA